MKLPNIIKICRHSDRPIIKDFYEKECGMYSDGKCDVDNKKCKLVSYIKEIK